MAVLYLWINAAVYVGLGLWCTIAPDTTSRAIGFSFAKAGARSEYITVYGGLEVGLGLFFGLMALNPALRQAGILMGLCMYGALALWRIATLVLIPGVGTFPKLMVVIEVGMAAWAAWIYFQRPAVE